MMKTKTLIITLSALLIFTGMATANTVRSETADKLYSKQHNMKGKQLYAFRQLELSAEQQAAMQQIIEKHRGAWQDYATDNAKQVSQRQQHRQAWQAIMDAPQFDPTSARELLQQNQEKRISRQLQAMQLRHELRQILTDEQRAQLDEQRRQQPRERKGERRRDRQPKLDV